MVKPIVGMNLAIVLFDFISGCVRYWRQPGVRRQLLIVSVVLGLWEAFKLKFVKRYANMAEEAINAM